jgi:hypothetical protein
MIFFASRDSNLPHDTPLPVRWSASSCLADRIPLKRATDFSAKNVPKMSCQAA